jgi:TRAP-type transport system large permease protein
MPVILLAGIYGGATTPTEAAAVAALYALLLAAFLYRSVSWRSLYNVFSESAKSSASVGLVIGSALIFNYIVAVENIPRSVAHLLEYLDLGSMAFLLFANLLFLFLGCLLDATTIILVIIPLFIPACRVLGIDLVHFGVVAVVNCMIGLITPPYGMLLFVINGATGIPVGAIVREVIPYLAVLIFLLLLLIVFPELTLWLPRQFGYDG